MPVRIIVLLLSLLMITSVSAQDNELAVMHIDGDNLHWGYQNIDVKVKNLTDYVKFMIVETEAVSDDANEKLSLIKTHFLIEPSAEKIITPRAFLPGDFGKGVLTFKFYDVIDTMDIPLESQIFYTEIKPFQFTLSPALKKYTEYPITLPPRVDKNPMFNSDFIKIFIQLLDEGKSLNEIAALTNSDSSYVIEQAKQLNEARFVNYISDQYKLKFPLIKNKEAKEAAAYADSVSDILVNIIADNMPSYKRVIDSLIAAGTFPRDSSDFLSGATFYMRPYPIIASMLLWYDWGNKFITGAAPLVIYDGTDLCNALIYQYMYAVEGGDDVNGHQFYGFWLSAKSYAMLWDNQQPDLECDEDFIIKRQKQLPVKWRYEHPNYPDFFLIDTNVVRPILNGLGNGADTVVEKALYNLHDIPIKYNHGSASFGYRYWIWNYIATRTLDKLVENKVVEPFDKNFYRLDSR